MIDLVKVADRRHVRTAALNRAQVKTLSSDFAWSVINAIDDAPSGDNVQIIVIMAAGGAFCAGLDLTMKERGSIRRMLGLMISDEVDISAIHPQTLRQTGCWRRDRPASGRGTWSAVVCDVRLIAKRARLMMDDTGATLR